MGGTAFLTTWHLTGVLDLPASIVQIPLERPTFPCRLESFLQSLFQLISFISHAYQPFLLWHFLGASPSACRARTTTAEVVGTTKVDITKAVATIREDMVKVTTKAHLPMISMVHTLRSRLVLGFHIGSASFV